MRNFLAKIWVPILLVGAAGLQTFGIDAARMSGLAATADSLHLFGQTDSSDAVALPGDSVLFSEELPDSTFAEDADTLSMAVETFVNGMDRYADSGKVATDDTEKVYADKCEKWN